ncbi:hypothetical protein B0T19DRAFT_464619 [Cercophora scortea]|uniref:LysM domain-containing protein n=1 Tax=Cercophora scortea TaxID=314031 RepID=A0AAE0M9N6_9PEZI|nr:hypothetical protein B0T19DRAFT_464619 [Cercophora scortea]
MMSSILTIIVLALSTGIATSTASATPPFIARRDKQNAIPKYRYDPNTTRYCFWWLDSDGSWTCDRVEREYGVSMVDFHQWNPSVQIPCGTLPAEQSFCVAALDESPRPSWTFLPPTVTIFPPTVTVSVTVPAPASTISITTIVTFLPPTTTFTPGNGNGNGIATPTPFQPGMVTNCNAFYFVQPGDTCAGIAARYRLAPEQIVAWNPYARADCTRLLAGEYCCVGVL